jgi:hypothetical protein
MSDLTGQPTEAEIEAYFAQLREAPVGELLMQCIGMLAGAAEAKLGRKDARPAIDGMAALAQIGAPHLGEQAAAQLEAAVARLQMAQVQLERHAPQDEQPEQPGQAEQPEQASAPEEAAEPAEQPRQTDKLWIPGR